MIYPLRGYFVGYVELPKDHPWYDEANEARLPLSNPEITYLGDHPLLGVRAVGFDTNYHSMSNISFEEAYEMTKDLVKVVLEAMQPTALDTIHEKKRSKNKRK